MRNVRFGRYCKTYRRTINKRLSGEWKRQNGETAQMLLLCFCSVSVGAENVHTCCLRDINGF